MQQGCPRVLAISGISYRVERDTVEPAEGNWPGHQHSSDSQYPNMDWRKQNIINSPDLWYLHQASQQQLWMDGSNQELGGLGQLDVNYWESRRARAHHGGTNSRRESMDGLQWVADSQIIRKFSKYVHSCVFLGRGLLAFIRPSQRSLTLED